MENECRHFANIAINVEGSGTGIVPEGEGGGEGEGRPVLKRAILGGGGKKRSFQKTLYGYRCVSSAIICSQVAAWQRMFCSFGSHLYFLFRCSAVAPRGFSST